MAGHIYAAAAEGDAFGLEAEALLEAGVAGEADVAAGSQDAMPGDAAVGIVQGPGNLAGGAGESGGPGDIAVGGHPALRNAQDGAAQFLQHKLS